MIPRLVFNNISKKKNFLSKMEQVSKQKLNWVSVVDESESEQNCNEDVKDSKLEVEVIKEVKLDTCECITKNNKKCPNLKKKGDTMFCALHRHYYDTKCRSEKLNSEPKVKVLENPSDFSLLFYIRIIIGLIAWRGRYHLPIAFHPKSFPLIG